MLIGQGGEVSQQGGMGSGTLTSWEVEGVVVDPFTTEFDVSTILARPDFVDVELSGVQLEYAGCGQAERMPLAGTLKSDSEPVDGVIQCGLAF